MQWLGLCGVIQLTLGREERTCVREYVAILDAFHGVSVERIGGHDAHAACGASVHGELWDVREHFVEFFGDDLNVLQSDVLEEVAIAAVRSEERRVGKEGRARRAPHQERKE